MNRRIYLFHHNRRKKDESNEDGGDEPQKRFIGEEELEAATRAEEEEAQKRSTEGTMGKWEAVSKIQPTNNRLESSSNMINNRERIVSQLSINCDPDNKPIRRLFTERNLEVDTDILEGMEIKVKVDRRAKKHEKMMIILVGQFMDQFNRSDWMAFPQTQPSN
ncbi:hypothetical protein H4Q26_004714 [Puccinia striiformis f. sp. tritici PST-130]|nr:hypothetical protein H4Q26_004714 [Puccinia striiformis f. sp. tritici PST-130]